jgi:hypothetical protein
VAVILSTQPAASALAMLLPSVDAPQCRAAFVLASSRLLYIGVGELVPCLRGAPQARPLRQMVLIALGVLLCAVMPAMGAI